MQQPISHPQGRSLSGPLDWQYIIREAGCFDFLLPRATRAADEVLHRWPVSHGLFGAEDRSGFAELCMGRLQPLYERLILRATLERLCQGGSLPTSASDLDPISLRSAAEAVREDLLSDGGAALEADAPLVRDYESAIVRNYVSALVEMLGHLQQEREEISRQLLGGKPLGHIQGIADAGSETHRHGRAALRIQTEAGAFYYKPRPWETDALLEELLDCWFPGCAVVPRYVCGDGYSFAAELVSPPLDEEGLGEYWYHFGALAALFHGLGSRDMTEDNVLCAGTRPAVIDTETLLAAGVARQVERRVEPRPSVLNSSLLPWPEHDERRSPLTTDNASANCLPRVDGVARTIAGFEQVFVEGFAVGYRRLVKTRGEVSEILAQARSVPCRKVLLNTWTYVRARANLFSVTGLRSALQQERMVRWLWDRYEGPSAAIRLELAKADVVALAEGDIPHYRAPIGGLTLEGADPGCVIDGVLAESALELACRRLDMLSEDELGYELEVIKSVLCC